ncbi:regulation of nuclear pre-mRNA domain-containing protein 1B [Melanaphis sacchari]|uniref:regulation of nuclear pre-mRNA domain-containing protein 1B n=1 Tax=Melanaphis sacchari TaxID=742174 RepID=UPI000DC134C8|nr:regulation of nuclear pre-mRNA domain-containing protein 1B [Melanaphis sacchari]XP_025195938.1 regulation of nuclear pre-mRNA domain-containing protein 1B [Melanaphis sacchari]XP_025195940.1 regulation of nuclear pre-mRNA domain-containing protein 1B [Melanaphis sacchari]
MTSFTEAGLNKRLKELNSSQQSIQTLSLWLIHHRKYAHTVVKIWSKEILAGSESKQLTLMYLANDVIQNSKKKGPEYGLEFGKELAKAFNQISLNNCSSKTRQSLTRLLNIWEERGVYSKIQIDEFKDAFVKETEEKPKDEPPNKKVKHSHNHKLKKTKSQNNGIKKDKEIIIEVDGTKELHVTLSPKTPVNDPPEPEELIKALNDLENAPSCDAVVRERISKLPPEIADVSLLSQLKGKDEGEELLRKVNDAVALLTDYNTRLVCEMEDRKKVSSMLHDFIQSQRDLIDQAEQRLQEYQGKLQKVCQVRQEVNTHLQNLPDLAQLPSVKGGLAPLPSAGDLFTVG